MRIVRKHPKSRQGAIYVNINTFTNISHSTASLYVSMKMNPYRNPRFHYFIYTKRPFKYFLWKNTLNLNNEATRYTRSLRFKSYRPKYLSSFRTYRNIQVGKINSKRKNIKER